MAVELSDGSGLLPDGSDEVLIYLTEYQIVDVCPTVFLATHDRLHTGS